MREPFTQLYVHLVWSTWDRLSLIDEKIQPQLYAAMAQKCRSMKCEPIEIGGVEDHVHLLCQLHPAVSISDLVKEVKGSSSHLMNHQLLPQGEFKWQGAYGAFSIRKEEVPAVREYIANQSRHHAEGTVERSWERSEKE